MRSRRLSHLLPILPILSLAGVACDQSDAGPDIADETSTDSGDDTDETGSDDGDDTDSDPSGGLGLDFDEPWVLWKQSAQVNSLDGAPAGVGEGGFIRTADDFEISDADACWSITEVHISGRHFEPSGSVNELELSFHADAGGLPSASAQVVETGVPEDLSGQLIYRFDTPVVLEAGVHWLALLPDIGDIVANIWYWEPSDESFGSAWAMSSDVAPFLPGCDGWGTGNDCFDFGVRDLAFELRGYVGCE